MRKLITPLSETKIDGGYGNDSSILSNASDVSFAVLVRSGFVYAIREKQSTQTSIYLIPPFLR